ncbi:hypothetical protein PPHE_a1228 [Pseudoalteromonas phenolica O-BC30]|nr:hypothetical protein [Pseudoalteromonas phenolica O-BC30]
MSNIVLNIKILLMVAFASSIPTANYKPLTLEYLWQSFDK